MGRAHRGNIDDIASVLALRQEYLNRLAHGIQGPIGIDVEQPLDHFIGHVTHSGVVIHNARIVDQHIQPPKGFHGSIDHSVAGGGVRYIADIWNNLTGFLLQCLRQCVQPFFSAGNGNNIGPLLRKQRDNCLPHACRSAGDHNGFSLKLHLVFLALLYQLNSASSFR